MPFRVVALDHVQLAMPPGAEAEAEAFYTGLLGLTRHPKPEPLAARGGCWFSNDPTGPGAPDEAGAGPGVVLHLGVEADFRPARKAHPALVVEDLADLAARLTAAGAEVRPDTELPGVTRCFVDDPFGNRIELIDAAGPAAQG